MKPIISRCNLKAAIYLNANSSQLYPAWSVRTVPCLTRDLYLTTEVFRQRIELSSSNHEDGLHLTQLTVVLLLSFALSGIVMRKLSQSKEQNYTTKAFPTAPETFCKNGAMVVNMFPSKSGNISEFKICIEHIDRIPFIEQAVT